MPTREARLSFADGAAFRIEISSVENPQVLKAVIEEAALRSVPVHRVSQGSGIGMLTDTEIKDMAGMGAENGIEVSLWASQRAGWGGGAHARSRGGASAAAAVRGAAGLRDAVSEVIRAARLGIGSALVPDIGLIRELAIARAKGDLPESFQLKSSVSLPVLNPSTAVVLEELGINSINAPVDLSIVELEELRAAVSVPLDIYIEGPDDFGGVCRYDEAARVVAAATPVYLKFAVRNAPPIYPVGLHSVEMVKALARERVRRAEICLAKLARES